MSPTSSVLCYPNPSVLLLQVFDKNSRGLLQQLVLQMGKTGQLEEALATMALTHQQTNKVCTIPLQKPLLCILQP